MLMVQDPIVRGANNSSKIPARRSESDFYFADEFDFQVFPFSKV